MFCRKCGTALPDGCVFCPECGEKIINQAKTNKSGRRLKYVCIVVVLLAVVIFVKIFWGNGNQEIELSPNAENASVWSTDYLFWYISNSDMDANKYLKTAIEFQDKAEELGDDTYLFLNDGFFGDGSFEQTGDQTKYLYRGELKNNKPSGFGMLAKYYQFNTELSMYVPIYIGEFRDGMYDGEGVLYYDYSDTEVVTSIAYTTKANEENIDECIDAFFQSIEYIGEFDKGTKNGQGIMFIYPDINFYYYANSDEESLDMKNISAYIGEFKDGMYDGKGKHYYHQLLIYDGEYKENKLEGQGVSYYPDTEQKKYDGEWKNNVYDGSGTLYDETGSIIYKGKWENGNRVN